MTRDELSSKLDQLDPGARLSVDERALAGLFGATSLDASLVEAIEALAIEHRCTFAWHEPGRSEPVFEKDDIF